MSTTDTRDDTVTSLPEGLLDNILKHINPRRVIPFGSRAKGMRAMIATGIY